MALGALKHEVVSVDGAVDWPLPVTALRRWLHGSWALLFSHADDFACYGFEADRWLAHVREAFAGTRVRPLALTSSKVSCSSGWVGEVGGCSTRIHIDETQRYPVSRDANEHALSTAILNAGTRFVMILDDSLRLRRTFAYTTQDQLPSPIDLVAMAETLRNSLNQRKASWHSLGKR